MSALELLANPHESDDGMAQFEHMCHIREIGEVVRDIEALIRDTLNAGLSPTGPEVGALRAIIDQYRIAATMVAARILEKKLSDLS